MEVSKTGLGPGSAVGLTAHYTLFEPERKRQPFPAIVAFAARIFNASHASMVMVHVTIEQRFIPLQRRLCYSPAINSLSPFHQSLILPSHHG